MVLVLGLGGGAGFSSASVLSSLKCFRLRMLKTDMEGRKPKAVPLREPLASVPKVMVLAQSHYTSAKSSDSFRESPPLFELRRADVAATVRSLYTVCTEEKFRRGEIRWCGHKEGMVKPAGRQVRG